MKAAMRHPDRPGAGAARRKKLGLFGREKVGVVMREFARGTLRSGSGHVVTNPQQAKAIAMSEGRAAESRDVVPHPRKAGLAAARRIVDTDPETARSYVTRYGIRQGTERALAWAQDNLGITTTRSALKSVLKERFVPDRKRGKIRAPKGGPLSMGDIRRMAGEAVTRYKKLRAPEEPTRHSAPARANPGHSLSRKTKEHWHNPRSAQPVDDIAVHELDLYIENESSLYPQKKAIIEAVKRKMRAGTYDAEKAPKLWHYWVLAGAQKYVKEFGGEIRVQFPPPVRMKLAEQLAKDYAERIRGGEYGADWQPKPKVGRRAAGPLGHNSPYSVVYGGTETGPFLPPDAFHGPRPLNHWLQKLDLHLWDTGIPSVDEAREEAATAARAHAGAAVVYDEHTGQRVAVVLGSIHGQTYKLGSIGRRATVKIGSLVGWINGEGFFLMPPAFTQDGAMRQLLTRASKRTREVNGPVSMGLYRVTGVARDGTSIGELVT
jgi:hypothetical protein